MTRHPRDRFVTVYGRKPALEALEDPALTIAKVFLAKGARGDVVQAIREAARRRGVAIEERSAEQVARISRKPNQDQGVAVDVEAPAMRSIGEALDALGDEAPARMLALDGVTTPANVGMILRTATVLGWGGVIVPRRGCPEIGPLVIKASAGVAFRAPIVRCEVLADALSDAKLRGFCAYGLSDRGTVELAALAPRDRSIFVLGNESEGISEATRPLIDEWVRIAMASARDSLNVASAAAIVAWALRP